VKIHVIGHDAVTELLTLSACMPVMRATLESVSRGEGHQPLRSTVAPPGLAGFLGLMPGYLGGAVPALGIKMLGIYPNNAALGKEAHQGVVMLLDPATGEPRAVVNASAITSVRTAAVSALATDALARTDATELAVIGTGVQAQWHVRAIAEVRKLDAVRITGRDSERGRAVAAKLTATLALPVVFMAEPADAVREAGIVVTATNSSTPVLDHAWLAPGTHINAVGACVPGARELDTATVAASRFIVDRRESATEESGDYLFAARESGLGPEHIAAELGEVLAGTVAGRIADDELTVFESLGLAVEDLAAAQYVVAMASGTGRGSVVEF
jgi:ornithine cyclodeaminase/alanine dehydrogenase-like protein (mu-crystallin family)